MTGSLPLGRAATVSGKQALTGFLITLALTDYRTTMRLNGAFLKPGAHARRRRETGVLLLARVLQLRGCVSLGKYFFLPDPHCSHR